MATFKFVCRYNEIQEVMSSIKENQFVVLHTQNNSGLTHFLKKIMQLLWEDNCAGFYIDGESKMSISEQIIGQVMSFSKEDSSAQKSALKTLKNNDKSGIISSIIASCFLAFDAIPVVTGIGTLANSLITSITETIDADREHIEDYKKEKAITRFCEKLSKKLNNHIYFLIDNTVKLNIDEYPFISLLLERYQVFFLFTFDLNRPLNEYEFISKFHSLSTHSIYRLPSDFERPDEQFIGELYQCYGKEYLPQKIETFNRYDRNIHIIMADILGIPMDINNFPQQTQYLLKVLMVLRKPVSKSILFPILKLEDITSHAYGNEFFESICQQALKYGIISIDEQNENVMITRYASSISQVSYIEELNITKNIIKVLDTQIDNLEYPLYEFAISKLEHDYSHCKQYILAYAKLSSRKRKVPLDYLDKLQFLDEAKDLFFIVGLYYDYGIYDKPYRLLQTHKMFSRQQNYKIAHAMLCERLHINNYVDKLECLYNGMRNKEKKCLLASILFVAYLNSDEAQKYKVFFDENSKYYYGLFKECNNFFYLLRNISYYIDDISTAIINYEDCLNNFRLKDPISYNRTISNYFCYLMRNDVDQIAAQKLVTIANEVQHILDYNDPAYSYLNINYGIYLMYYTQEDPVAYFSSIPYSAGTTETPFIYAQINLAMYYVKINSFSLALNIMDDIKPYVYNTSVPRTRQFFNINYAVVQYANGIFPSMLLSEIIDKPLRGNLEFAYALKNQYNDLAAHGTSLDWQTVKKLSLPGYIFYRYFDANKLLVDF